MYLRQVVKLAAAVLAILSREVRAQSLAWDADPSTAGAQGGSGNWLFTNFWLDGATNTPWLDNSMATFGGTAGNVNLNGNVSANGLVFSANGYTIDGASTLALTNPTIDVPGAAHQAFINVAIGGSVGLVKNGPGTL